MYNIVKKQQNTITLLAKANTFDDAERILINEAQKNGGNFFKVTNGLSLVKKGNTIEEHKVITRTPNFFSWLLSSSTKSISVLEAEYSIVHVSEINNSQKMNDDTKQENCAVNSDESTMKLVLVPAEEMSTANDKTVTATNDEMVTAANYEMVTAANYEVVTATTNESNDEMVTAANGETVTTATYKISTNETINSETKNQEAVTDIVTEEIILVKKMVSLLSKKRSDDYLDWLHVNYVLNNISNELYDCFVEFTNPVRRDPERCKRIWLFKDKTYNISHLHQWAKSDNPIEYEKLMNS